MQRRGVASEGRGEGGGVGGRDASLSESFAWASSPNLQILLQWDPLRPLLLPFRSSGDPPPPPPSPPLTNPGNAHDVCGALRGFVRMEDRFVKYSTPSHERYSVSCYAC